MAKVFSEKKAFGKATALSLAASYGRIDNCRLLLELSAELSEGPSFSTGSSTRKARVGSRGTSTEMSFQRMESILATASILAETTHHDHCKRLIDEAIKKRAGVKES